MKNPNHPITIKEIQQILGLSEEDLYLTCIEGDSKIYSCNNRRLCMYKTLYRKKIFDGYVLVKYSDDCAHKIECINQECDDIRIQYGKERGKMC